MIISINNKPQALYKMISQENDIPWPWIMEYLEDMWKGQFNDFYKHLFSSIKALLAEL